MAEADKADNVAQPNQAHGKAWREPFLETLAATCNVSAAARAGKVHRSVPYAQRANDAEFAAQWAEAEQEALDSIELTIFNSAIGGNPDLAKFFLRNRRPEVWNKAPDTLLSTGDGPLQIEVRIMELPANADV